MMKVNDLTTVYKDDCFKHFKKIEDNSIDLILTDPPYEIGYKDNIAKGEAKKRGEKLEVKAIKNDEEGDIDWDTFFKECHRVLKPKKMLYLCCRTDMVMRITGAILDSGLRYCHDFLWFKGDMGYGNLNIMGVTHELVLGLSKETPEKSRVIQVDGVDKKRTPAFYFGKTSTTEYVGHPTQKPVGMMMYIVENRTDPGDLVLDPFCGSASTLMACQILGRKSIGIEMEQEWCDKAIARLKDEHDIEMYKHMHSQGLRVISSNVLSYPKPVRAKDAPKKKRGKVVEQIKYKQEEMF